MWGGPSSSRSKLNRTALKARPLIPSPHFFSALFINDAKQHYDKHFKCEPERQQQWPPAL
jgi:hypothetical protein